MSSRYWPKNAWALSQQLDRLAPNLRAVGIGIDRKRTARERLVSLWLAEDGPPPDDAVTQVTQPPPAHTPSEPDGLWPPDEED